MLRSRLWDYSDAYIIVSATLTVANTAAAAANNRKNLIIKNWAPFTSWITEINNTQIDNAKDIGIAMPIYNLIAYSDNYSQNVYGTTTEMTHFQIANGAIADFLTDNNKSALFEFKTKKAGRTGNNGTKMLKVEYY